MQTDLDKVELKPLRYQDLQFVTNIRNRYRFCYFNSKQITFEDTYNWFSNLISNFYIIYYNKNYAGTISVRVNEIGNVALLPKYRGKGIMGKVMEEIRKLYPSMKFHLEVKPGNHEAIRAYEKLGFKVTKYVMEEI
jgi:ribosomal protein S18 acetylase RimI-like enzyme